MIIERPVIKFDFWLGERDCTRGKNGKATNQVEHIFNAKVIQEIFLL